MHGERAMTSARPVVTAVRARGTTNVEIELDERSWRVLPLAAVARAGIGTGVVLDRERARALNRALRAERAYAAALRLLRHSDQTTVMLDAKLAHRGVPTTERVAVMETLTEARIVDDVRFARLRAEALSVRLYGDEAIRHDLAKRGIEGAKVEEALAELEPEASRVALVIEARGLSRQTVAFLARRGFAAEALEGIVARVADDGLG